MVCVVNPFSLSGLGQDGHPLSVRGLVGQPSQSEWSVWSTLSVRLFWVVNCLRLTTKLALASKGTKLDTNTCVLQIDHLDIKLLPCWTLTLHTVNVPTPFQLSVVFQ